MDLWTLTGKQVREENQAWWSQDALKHILVMFVFGQLLNTCDQGSYTLIPM